MPGCSATCPPRFALLLDLRRTPGQTALGSPFTAFVKPFPATGVACLPQRNQGGAQRAEDIRGRRYDLAVVDLAEEQLRLVND